MIMTMTPPSLPTSVNLPDYQHPHLGMCPPSTGQPTPALPSLSGRHPTSNVSIREIDPLGSGTLIEVCLTSEGVPATFRVAVGGENYRVKDLTISQSDCNLEITLADPTPRDPNGIITLTITEFIYSESKVTALISRDPESGLEIHVILPSWQLDVQYNPD